ncbi:hypothetical protein NMY22_g9110 [Coprinellus aureogranulatus]|nr:hypothetical protein NMY22_g9110 [Coprinellus aureogranulatus]
MIGGIHILDAPTIWETLIGVYSPKTASSRMGVIQELISICMRSPGHENETYQDYGSRCMALASRLTALLANGPRYIAEGSKAVKVPAVSDGKVVGEKDMVELTSPSFYREGYLASHLTRDCYGLILYPYLLTPICAPTPSLPTPTHSVPISDTYL